MVSQKVRDDLATEQKEQQQQRTLKKIKNRNLYQHITVLMNFHIHMIKYYLAKNWVTMHNKILQLKD